MPTWRDDIIYNLTWSAFDQAIGLLVHKLADKRVDAIVGIARGGLVPATALANHLEIAPFYTIRIRHNTSSDIWSARDGISIEQSFSMSLEGKHVLLVDDIAGDGDTLSSALSHLESMGSARAIITATLAVNIASRFLPDLFVYRVDGWVIFPWEQPRSVPDLHVQCIMLNQSHMTDHILSTSGRKT